MNTNFNGSGASQPDVNDPQYLPVIKSFVELLDEIIARKNAINTHAISLSTLKKWAEKRIDIDMINQTEGPLDELRNSVAVALQELALTVFNKHNSKNDHVIYAQLARQIGGLTPETLELLKNSQGMLDNAKASKPPLPVVAYVVIAVVVVGIYLAATRDTKPEETPKPVSYDMPESFTTVDGASVSTTGTLAHIDETSTENAVERTPMVKVINKMDKLAKMVMVGVEGHPVYTLLIEPKSQRVIRDMKFGVYTFRVATGSREALLTFAGGKARWEGTSFEDEPADTVVALETKKEFSRTTIWLEQHPTKGVVYNILEEMSPKPKQ